MVVSLGQKFHTTGFCQRFEGFNDVWSMFFKLLEQNSGDGIGYPELLFMFFDQVEHDLIGGNIGFIRYFVQDLYVETFIFYRTRSPDIKKRKLLQPVWLV